MLLPSILTDLKCHKHLMIIDVGIRSSDCIQMILSPFDLFWWDDSNGDKIIFLASILTEIQCYKCFSYFNQN
jgi:hypothetical protein